MEIKNLFKKDITRDIEGVVTIGNEEESRKKQELEEYVCTEEVVKNFRYFFTAYRKSIQVPTDKIGVWITGFFGSGKSHFLKILGYVLSNENVGGKASIDYFDDKIADPMIKADMVASASQNNLVVLFNIDSKAKSDAKGRNLSIMETMLNCFNEKIGLSGSIPWLADLERNLISEGIYEKFQQRFQEVSGKEWKKYRKDIFLLRDKFIQALVDVKGISKESAIEYFNDCQRNYSLSIETFSQTITDYCQNNNRRVVFLIDEVGQFIGTNSDMMLGLQTVVEDLGKYAQGKAWVVVTSQQQIDALVEGSNKSAQMDFSKIQGRFATRLTMSSSNADEVIKKRLLDKTEDSKNLLGTIYSENKDRLNNLLIFPSTPKWSGYSSDKQFIDDYPFVNYQFELLQKVFDSIRESGMTEGKSISSGERSLLSAFKKSAEAKCRQEVGLLIPFNDFYSTAEEFMDWNIKQVFNNAIKRMPDPFDVEVLKVLFMLKNVKDMEPTIERIATLMVSDIKEDKVVLKDKIKASLDRLIGETFAQQNGDRYEFLTNEEQDVNKRIKNSQYNTSDVLNRIRDIFYDNVVECDKSYQRGKYSFGINRFVDGNIPGVENPDNVTVKIYTPWQKKDVSMQQESMISDSLVIDLTNGSYLEELIFASKINTFDRNNSTNPTSSMMEILNKKRAEADERIKRAETNIRNCLKDADFYQNGSLLDNLSHDPKKRFEEGINRAIDNKFNKLDYVKEFANKIDDVSAVLRSQPYGIGSIYDVDANANALKDIVDRIKDDKVWSRNTTLKSLIERFSKAPYGYRPLDIRAMVARLLINNIVKAKERGQVANYHAQNFQWDFSKGSDDEYIVIELQEKIDEAVLMKVKRIMKDSFDVTIELKETSLRDDCNSFFKAKYDRLSEIVFSSKNQIYPGKDVIEKMRDLFGSICSTDDAETIFKKVVTNENALEDYGSKLDSILGFYKDNGPQMKTWNKANELVQYYFDNEFMTPALQEMDETIKKMEGILKMPEPFNMIQVLGQYTAEANAIKDKVFSQIKETAIKVIKDNLSVITKEGEEALAKKYEKQEVRDEVSNYFNAEKDLFDKLLKATEEPEHVDQARSKATDEVSIFRRHLSEIMFKDKGEEKKAKRIKSIRASELIPVANKAVSSQEEVDHLVKNIKDYLESLLKDNDEIDIN